MVIETEVKKQELPFTVGIVVTFKNNKPALEIRRLTTDLDIIKTIVTCAFNNIPILVIPKFKDDLKSLSSLIEKGILYKKEDKFYFTI